MDQNGPSHLPEGLRVFTAVKVIDPADSLVSPVPLHPKVKDYLRPMMATLRFQIGDALPQSFNAYNMDVWARRKILYVTWTEIHNPTMRIGAQDVMVFDQATGELLHEGTDGGE